MVLHHQLDHLFISKNQQKIVIRECKIAEKSENTLTDLPALPRNQKNKFTDLPELRRNQKNTLTDLPELRRNQKNTLIDLAPNNDCTWSLIGPELRVDSTASSFSHWSSNKFNSVNILCVFQ